MHRKIFYFLLFLALCPVLLTAGTRGRIKGKVVDLQTGEGLIGANVVVVGTTTGANTDANGEFLLQNLEAGVYTLKASYVGYKSITLLDVRVNADLTAYVSIQLPSEDIQVGTVEIVAQKPMIQKDATNAVRITTNDDIQALPVRGVNSIVGLTAGVVAQNGNLYIRGGRQDEVGYYLEGVSITNPFAGGRAVTLSQDALEEIQVQSGGYTAEFGGANAGIVRQQLRSGGPEMKASLEWITDNISFKSKNNFFDGKKNLGAYSWGYNETSAVLSGPLIDNRFKYFFNFDYVYNRDSNPQQWPGANLGIIGDPSSGDTVNLVYPGGPLQGVQNQQYTYTGTFNMDFKPVLLRFSGTYTASNGDINNPLVGGIIRNLMQTRHGRNESSNGAFTVKLTHVLSQSMYYELTAGYYMQKSVNFTPGLGSDYWSYGDSVASANLGWTIQRTPYDIANGRVGRYVTPTAANVMGFTFTRNGTVPVDYSIFDRHNISFSGALSFLIGKAHSFKVGGDYTQYTLRNWSGVVTTTLANKVYQYQTANPNGDLNAYKRQLLLTGGVNNYGYDVFGNVSDAGFDAAHKPVFASAYIQDRIEYEDLIINAGLRYDYIDIDNLMFADPSRPEDGIDKTSGEMIASGWTKVPTFSSVSPRLGFSFPVTDKTVFHAQYGKFVQQPSLSTAYRGYYRIGFEIKGGFFIPTPAGSNIRPTRTTQYELGFTQQLADFMSFDITGYYRDISDEVQYMNQAVNKNSPFQNYNTLANGDYATTKGIEISLNMRRYERISLNANLSFQDARGTGSDPFSNTGVVGAPLDGVTVFYPKYVSLLSYNQNVRGNVNVDYRFGPNDGPSILHDFGVSVLATFNSGHPYTLGTGALNAETDSRFRLPIEALNSSVTPSQFQVDLRVDKTIPLFDKLSLNVYVFVINLFDNSNVNNVFLRTGSAQDDGVVSNPELAAQLIATYGARYADVYKTLQLDYQGGYGGGSLGGATGGGNLYGPPRQIRLGFRLEY